jgi:nitroreductase
VIGTFLIFGKPSKSLGGKAVNTFIHSIAGADNKLPVEKIFFLENFDNPGTPPEEISMLVEAARRSPSAVNVQPWRLLWRDGQLYLFMKRNNKRYGNSQDYRFYDSGICIGNITLAMEALSMNGSWRLYNGDEPAIPEHPDDLEALASLRI